MSTSANLTSNWKVMLLKKNDSNNPADKFILIVGNEGEKVIFRRFQYVGNENEQNKISVDYHENWLDARDAGEAFAKITANTSLLHISYFESEDCPRKIQQYIFDSANKSENYSKTGIKYHYSDILFQTWPSLSAIYPGGNSTILPLLAKLIETKGLGVSKPLPRYNAPSPMNSKLKLRDIRNRVLFPPILLWDVSKFIANYIAGRLIGRFVLPAQSLHDEYDEYKDYVEQKLAYFQSKFYSPLLNAERLQVTTHNGSILDTFEITQRETIPKEKQKYIIYFNGNGDCYENHLNDMEAEAKELVCNLISFNPRGVLNSRGKMRSKDDLVTDGIAQVQRLLDSNVRPENITLKGHSLGGAVATLVAKHFHDQEKTVKLFNDRSFSTITNAFSDNFHGFMRWIIKPFAKIVLTLTNWEMNAATAYKSLPESYKRYIVVRSSKADRKKYGSIIDDGVIPYEASLHAALKNERHKEKLRNKEELFGKNTSDINAELNKEQSKKANARFTNCKMTTSNKNTKGHNVSMRVLKDRNGNNATNYFKSFFNDAQSETNKNSQPIAQNIGEPSCSNR